MKNLLLSICLCICVVGRVDAGLIEWDAFKTGDGLAVKDEETGFIWLDLTQTVGQHINKVNNLYSGWELANYNIVEDLLEKAFPVINFTGYLGEQNKFEQACANTSDCFKRAENWQGLFGAESGVNRSYQTYSYGLYFDNENVLRMGGAYKNGSGSANLYGTAFNVGYSLDYENKYANGDFNYFGFFLINSDSIPKPKIRLLQQVSPLAESVSAPSNTSLIFLSLGGLLLFSRRFRQ